MGDGSTELRDEFNEGLIRLLECPVCTDYMTSLIYVCKNQHTLCCSCKVKLSECPTCRAEILETRCLFAESVAQNLLFPCENSVAGCNEKHLVKNKSIHESVCPYRLYDCILGHDEECEWQGRYNEIQEHAEENHSDCIWYRPNGRSHTIFHNFNLSDHLNGVRLIISYNRMFWYNFNCDFEKGKWYSTFLYTDPDKKAGDFSFDFEFLSRNGEESVKFSNFIVHEDTTQVDTIYTSGKCVCIDISFISNFLDDNVLHLTYTIKKK